MITADVSPARPTNCFPRISVKSVGLVGKILWALYFVSFGFYAGAAVVANTFFQSAMGGTLSQKATRMSCFLVIMLIAAIMIVLQAAPVSYLPLAAAWFGVASRWSSGAVAAGILILGEVAWISFGIFAGSMLNIICGSLAIAVILSIPLLRRFGISFPVALSPTAF